jgi:carboxymethylenebutenolidase
VVVPDFLGDTGVLEKISPEIFKEMKDPETRHAAQAKMRDALQPTYTPEFAQATHAKLSACFEHLMSLESSNGSAGILGFCFGGTWSFFFATKEPRLKAAVIFYGQPPKQEDIAAIRSPILAFYGEKDENLMKSLPVLKDAMLEEGKDFSSKVYSDAGHAFFNDTNKDVYNADAAHDAWNLSLEFLKENLE